MADSKFERYVKHVPSTLKPDRNPVLKAFLEVIADNDDVVTQALKNTKDQIFIPTANGLYLDRLGNNRGVSRPVELGLLDEDYRKLIPVLGFQAKQIRKVFYDLMDVFWGPLFSRANITAVNSAPYAVSSGETIKVKINGGTEQVVKILSGDLATNGTATISEMSSILSRIKGATVSIVSDVANSTEKLNVRTNAVGPSGSIEFTGGSALSGSGIDLSIKKLLITDLDQRTAVYELRHRELLIELPAVLPILRRSLKGSHHFHTDSTITGDSHIGSFLYSNSKAFSITSQKAALSTTITKGSIVTTLTVDDTSSILEPTGFLIFGFGTDVEEQPVKYLSIPNSNTILIDPSHVFANNHLAGTFVNVISNDLKAYTPRVTGEDLAVYLTSPAEARSVAQDLLKTLAAAGVIIKFVINFPSYKYLCDNPYNP